MSTFNLSGFALWRCRITGLGCNNRRLLFCDINGKKINALDTARRSATWFARGRAVACRPDAWSFALRHRVVLFGPRTRAIAIDAAVPNRQQPNQIWVGRCAFWSAAWIEPPRQPLGSMYGHRRWRMKEIEASAVSNDFVVARQPHHVSFQVPGGLGPDFDARPVP